jgi:hypothetical protein
MIPAYPLSWPAGWPRIQKGARTRAKFSNYRNTLSIADGVRRVYAELDRLKAKEADIIISSNMRPTMGGWPDSKDRLPDDPGIAVYWKDRKGQSRVMAIDRYDRVADNLAAIAATLEALRAIERHGGGQILERAFTGFEALPAPAVAWRETLGIAADVYVGPEQLEDAYKRARSKAHPDKGGTTEAWHAVERAYDAGLSELRLNGTLIS